MTTSRIAIVTGANRGLGKATALALAADGADILLTYRSNADEAADVVAALRSQGRKAAALQLDTGDVASIGAFVEAVPATLAEVFGADRFDHLVNNAGHGTPTVLGSVDPATLDTLFAVHFRGPFLLVQGLAPLMNDGGSIVNISSGLSRFVGGPYSAYGSMKAAVDQLTRYFASELGARGIRVNAVAPGPANTDFAGGGNRSEAFHEMAAGRAALGRVGEPEDIGSVVAAAASARLGWVTGQRIEASGGTLL